MSRTNVYVDGFNLYYGALKDTEYRWLDLLSLAQVALGSRHEINRIRYFTANVSSRDDDPNQHRRQQVYLRAIQTLPGLTIHYGHFLAHERLLPLHPRPATPPFEACVMRVEEKGSDVNLAAHLLMDGFDDDYEVAVVLSNDSDLATPIRMVRERLRKTVGVLNPHRRSASKKLRDVASFYREVRPSALRRSQFPPEIEDSRRRKIVCPEEWRTKSYRPIVPSRDNAGMHEKAVLCVRTPPSLVPDAWR